ncbi:hypothetical protein [Cohnella mopanensis]|uniref:hypothetical protein n=1 Tax=Cohnella mopanensis TaxID=2911966 RepID=UPI001EF7BE21|nr:hypothetical protein [Cohnella mopanensis]
MKSKLVALLCVLTIVFGLIIYFAFPVPTKKIFPHSEDITVIHVELVRHNDVLTTYFAEVANNQKEIQGIMSILKSESYNRELAYKPNLTNSPNAIQLLTNLYLIEVNDKGFLVVNGKKYKMMNRKDTVFNQLYSWLEENGVTSKERD